jgi:hypothetical protein
MEVLCVLSLATDLPSEFPTLNWEYLSSSPSWFCLRSSLSFLMRSTSFSRQSSASFIFSIFCLRLESRFLTSVSSEKSLTLLVSKKSSSSSTSFYSFCSTCSFVIAHAGFSPFFLKSPFSGFYLSLRSLRASNLRRLSALSSPEGAGGAFSSSTLSTWVAVWLYSSFILRARSRSTSACSRIFLNFSSS